MNEVRSQTIEGIQKLAAGVIATSPAGHRLCLIGGFRYRLLSHSCRTSLDIDYHWDGNLDGKQMEIVDLLRSKLLPEVKRRFGYEGTVSPATGPDAKSPFVRTVLASFHRTGETPNAAKLSSSFDPNRNPNRNPNPFSTSGLRSRLRWQQPLNLAALGETPDRIELPVEVTCIPCLDKPVVRTVSGAVYLTASDADMIESKVIALFNRLFLEERDILDLFLFQDTFVADAAKRLRTKFDKMKISPESVADRCERLLRNRAIHARALNEIISNQVEAAVAANLKTAGGGSLILDTVVTLLADKLGIPKGDGS